MNSARFFGALSGLLFATTVASANPLARTVGNDDTITVKLPNQVSMTIVARDKQQLRELRAYKLDSLMVLLDSYITQAEAAGRRSKNGQVTMEFYPAKDQPNSKAAPEQVRVTVRGAQPRTERVEVVMGKKLGVQVETTESADGDRVSVKLSGDGAKSDSLRRAKITEKRNRLTGSDLGFDLGLNTLVNRGNSAANDFELRPIGSRYVSLNWKFWARTGKDSLEEAFVATIGSEQGLMQ